MSIKDTLIKIATLNKWKLILISLFVKFSFFFIFASLIHPTEFSNGFLYSIEGDSKDYVQPVENLLKNGAYLTNTGEHALRMPGLAPVLLLFRLFFNLSTSLNLLLISQTFLSAVSCYYFATICATVLKSKATFSISFILYTLSTYVSIWDNYILTESFATSAIIFTIYYFYKAINEERKVLFLIAGTFIAWSIFLRPFLLPFVVLIPIILLLRRNIPLSSILVFIVPFMLVESLWIVRNYQIDQQFVPLQSRVIYNDEGGLNTKLQMEWFIGSYVASFGGDHTAWNPRGASNWFFNEKNNKNRFPSIIFENGLKYSDLENIKAKCIKYKNPVTSEADKEKLELEIKSKISTYYDNYVTENPFHFYITSRFIHFFKFNFHSGVYNIPFPQFDEQNIFQKLIKAFYAVMYLSVMLFGILGSLLGLYVWRKDGDRLIIVFIIGFILTLSPFVFKMHEFRFNTLAYPFLIITSLFFFQQVYIKLQSFNRQKKIN